MFEWKPGYSLQIASIDRQHQRLFRLGGRLYKAILAGDGKASIAESLRQLMDYANRHFAEEECFMRRHHYPALAEHCAEHQQFREQVAEFQSRLERGETVVSLSLIVFVHDWIERHIAGSDQKYGRYIRRQRAHERAARFDASPAAR